LGANLNSTALTGNYSYYIEYANAVGGPGNGITSRPTPLIGPVNVVNGRIQLTNLPVDASGQWTVRRIYRNTSTNSGTFEYVGEIPNMNPGVSYTDNTPDSAIQNNPQIDFTGPRVNTNTLLTNVLQYTNGTYANPFQLGTLTFSGTKGGRQLNPTTFTITPASTVLDLTTFLQQSLGIQTQPGPDPANPIPSDSSGANPGIVINANGQIEAVSNNGVDNAVAIGLSALQMTPTGGAAQSVNLGFSQTQAAVGQSAVSDVIVYDSLGIPINVRVTAVLQSRTATATTYRWFADSPQNDPLTGTAINVGTGLVSFDGQGKFISATNSTVAVDRSHIPSDKPLDFNLDFSQVSGLAAQKATLQATTQDGFPPGKLTSYTIGEDGIITGVFDNGTQRTLGQIELARFANPAGLDQRGQNLYAASTNSGLPVVGAPNSQGIGSVISGALEQSNTDVGSNLINLILASTAYRGNAQVISTAQQLLDQLLSLRTG
jgi:flagellar hook protein FlgE